MINWLHARLHDPRLGWDPVSSAYADEYSSSAGVDVELVDRFEAELGGLDQRRVVDLGSGPGRYAVEFARRGAIVTCVDVSTTYLAIARQNVSAASLTAQFVACYMDDVQRYAGAGFDGVFSSASWYYAMNDFSFAKRIASILAPGGVVVVRANNSRYEQKRGLQRSLVYWLNDYLTWKIGHPHPPPGRIAVAFRRMQGWAVNCDYRDPLIDLVVARKPDFAILSSAKER